MKQKYLNPRDNIYGRNITFVYGTVAEINRWGARRFGKQWDTLCPQHGGKYICWENDDSKMLSDYIITCKRFGRAYEISALAHEVLHHAMETLDRAGVKLSAGNDEPLTYYHQWLMQIGLGNMGIK